MATICLTPVGSGADTTTGVEDTMVGQGGVGHA